MEHTTGIDWQIKIPFGFVVSLKKYGEYSFQICRNNHSSREMRRASFLVNIPLETSTHYLF